MNLNAQVNIAGDQQLRHNSESEDSVQSVPRIYTSTLGRHAEVERITGRSVSQLYSAPPEAHVGSIEGNRTCSERVGLLVQAYCEAPCSPTLQKPCGSFILENGIVLS